MTELVHISLKTKLDFLDQEFALTILGQLLDITYTNAKLIVERDKYGDLIDVNIQFDNVEDATHFKLTHSWALYDD